MVCVCGVNCSECGEYGKGCEGCAAVSGKVFWAEYVGSDICPIYSCCVVEKGLKHCGECGELPCRIYFTTKDPRQSDEEHRMGIERRVAALKKCKLG